jgi:phosphoribosylformimino-5-aminoimidazole carboxamide ribotide isomerase
VVGSLAIREPDRVAGWLRRFGSGRIVVALDARQDADGIWRLPTHGWTQGSGADLDALLARYAREGAVHLLCTDIDRDGMMRGPNIELYRRIALDWPRFEVQASGGVSEAADVESARVAGCAGIVLGRALLEGRFRLEDVLRQGATC